MSAIKVVIVEDEAKIREMLSALISSNKELECTGAFENTEDAIINIPAINPDVVLVDIHLPGLSGIQCVSKLKFLYPEMQFIMCTALEDTDNIFNALQAGATGYLTKTTSPAKISEAIVDAYNGGSPMSSHIARKVISFFQNKHEKSNKELQKLSTREQEILQYLSKGYRYKEIASVLFINIETVRKHIHNIYEKLQVNSRTDALNKAFPKN